LVFNNKKIKGFFKNIWKYTKIISDFVYEYIIYIIFRLFILVPYFRRKILYKQYIYKKNHKNFFKYRIRFKYYRRGREIITHADQMEDIARTYKYMKIFTIIIYGPCF